MCPNTFVHSDILCFWFNVPQQIVFGFCVLTFLCLALWEHLCANSEQNKPPQTAGAGTHNSLGLLRKASEGQAFKLVFIVQQIWGNLMFHTSTIRAGSHGNGYGYDCISCCAGFSTQRTDVVFVKACLLTRWPSGTDQSWGKGLSISQFAHLFFFVPAWFVVFLNMQGFGFCSKFSGWFFVFLCSLCYPDGKSSDVAVGFYLDTWMFEKISQF